MAANFLRGEEKLFLLQPGKEIRLKTIRRIGRQSVDSLRLVVRLRRFLLRFRLA